MRAPTGMALLALLIAVALLTVAPTVMATTPQCDQQLSSQAVAAEQVPQQDESETTWICDGAVIVLGRGDVPMCLAPGASAVAPRIIHGIGDARIEAYHRHKVFDDPCELVAASDDAPDKLPKSQPDATVSALPALPPSADLPALVVLAPPQRATSGYRAEVFRPPRS